jgi:glycosyltransferase involved in cell wall biosynthesis
VDVDFFTPGETTERGYCLTVAAMAPYKRLDLAIAACEQLGVELRMVGDGPGAAALRRAAGPHTRLLGRVDDERLRELYRGALCFVQPGVEDFGIAAAEALACGCPVVALGVGGVVDIVESGKHGVLYAEAGDPSSLAAAIDKGRGLGFNKLNLRGRAEEFSRARFRERFAALLEAFDQESLRIWESGASGGEIR